VKFLLLAVIAFVVVSWLLRGKKAPPPAAASKSEEGAPEPMIQCAYCRVHLPLSESIAGSSGAVFCSEDHRRLGDLRA
jgi:uncharacterized protein